MRRCLLGLASFSALLVYFPLFFALLLSTAFGFHSATLFWMTFLAGIVISLLTLGVAAYYVYRVYNDTHLNPDQKIIWALLLLGFAPIGCPLFWWTMDKQYTKSFADGLIENRGTQAQSSRICNIDEPKQQSRNAGQMLTLTLGVASLSWLLFVAAFVLVIFSILIDWKPQPLIGFGVVFVAAIGVFATIFVVAYFLYHVSTNETLSADQKKFWGLVLFLLWPLGAPAYWYSHIYRPSYKERQCARDGSGIA